MNKIKCTPKISIVTVCYNCVNDIETTIKSVILQTYSNIEYVVIDGGSTDGTMDVIEKYRNKITHIISEPDKGIYDAMNKGINISSGDWVNFMNAGDSFYSENTLLEFFSHVTDTPHTGAIYGDVILKYPIGLYYKNCSDGSWCHQSVFFKNTILRNLKYDTSYKILADADLIRRMIASNYRLDYLPIAVSIYEGFDGMSANSGVRLYLEQQRLYNIDKNCKWFLILYFKKIKQYIKKWLHITNYDNRHLRLLAESLDNNCNIRRL